MSVLRSGPGRFDETELSEQYPDRESAVYRQSGDNPPHEALEKGADGVFVAGCMEGDCHFQAGNLRARKRVEYVQQLLQSIGMEPERVAMYNLSSGEGPRFAEISRDMTDKVRQLGPNPIKVKGERKEKAA